MNQENIPLHKQIIRTCKIHGKLTRDDIYFHEKKVKNNKRYLGIHCKHCTQISNQRHESSKKLRKVEEKHKADLFNKVMRSDHGE